MLDELFNKKHGFQFIVDASVSEFDQEELQGFSFFQLLLKPGQEFLSDCQPIALPIFSKEHFGFVGAV